MATGNENGNKKIIDWITIKGNHVPIYEGEDKLDAVDRYLSNPESSKADDTPTETEKNDTKVDLSKLNSKMYKGVWWGAKNTPMSVRHLLDKIIMQDGRGFTIKAKQKMVSDDLMADSITEYYLTDEEGVGKFKLDDNSIAYLLSHLKPSTHLAQKLSTPRK